MGGLRRRGSEEQEWVVVAYATGQVEAEIIAGRLRTADIPVYIHQESVGRVLGLSMGSLGMITVLVPARHEDEALSLLDEPTLDDLPPQVDGPTIDY
ncbi:MAG: DUF2007 domain-containing protein [Chloroflexi bacterium]|jgi:predicted NAD/FAD-binding protein|nr:DUF2007 domain-containing protein [Chloroflexota bacterium]